MTRGRGHGHFRPVPAQQQRQHGRGEGQRRGPEQAGQDQQRSAAQRVAETTTAASRRWALGHLGDPLTLAVLAEQANMGVRTFTRRFREETGVSPTRWLLQQRVDHARLLLETTDLSVDQMHGERALALRHRFDSTCTLRSESRRRRTGIPSPETARRGNTPTADTYITGGSYRFVSE